MNTKEYDLKKLRTQKFSKTRFAVILASIILVVVVTTAVLLVYFWPDKSEDESSNKGPIQELQISHITSSSTMTMFNSQSQKEESIPSSTYKPSQTEHFNPSSSQTRHPLDPLFSSTLYISTLSRKATASQTVQVESLSSATFQQPTDGKWARWSSWTDCSSTCGGGNRARSRTCSNPSPSQGRQYCVGRDSDTKQCAQWDCPDCSKVCTKGSLNSDCDACDCTTHVLYGTVTDTKGVPLANASIARGSTPQKTLTRTNLTGQFEVSGFCAEEEKARVEKDGYVAVDVNITVESPQLSSIRAFLTLKDPPKFVREPVNRLRTVGQKVQFCCSGKGFPQPTIEWFKNGNIIKETRSNNDTLVLEKLDHGDAGDYRCRLVTEYNSIFSKPAKLSIHTQTEDTCDPGPVPLYVAIPEYCSIENSTLMVNGSLNIQKCINTPCIFNNTVKETGCGRSEGRCCDVKEQEEVVVKCIGNITLTMFRVSSCGCQICLPPETFVKGIAKGRVDDEPLVYGEMFIEEEWIGYTKNDGTFSIKVEEDIEHLVVTFKDTYDRKLADTTKRLVFVREQTVHHIVYLVRKPEAVEFNSQSDTVLEIGGDSSSDGSSFAHVEVPSGSLVTKDGKTYEGVAKTRISVVDPRNASDFETAPGEFTTLDDEGETNPLISYGVFKMNFEDPSGQELASVKEMNVFLDTEALNISVNSNGSSPIKLWRLDLVSGLWIFDGDMEVSQGSQKRRRKRRELQLFLKGKVTSVRSYTNLDILFWRRLECFVKVKAFEDANSTEVKSARVFMVGKLRSGTNYGYEEGFTTTDYGVCLRIFCGNKGYIKATDPRGEQMFVSDDYNLQNYANMDISYNKENDYIMSFEANANEGGPVFKKKYECLAATSDDSYFRFQRNLISEGRLVEPTLPWKNCLAWYKSPSKDLRNYCFIKVSVNKHVDIIAQSFVNETHQSFGIYVAKPKDENGGTVCLQYRCKHKFDTGRCTPPITARVRILPSVPNCVIANSLPEELDINTIVDNPVKDTPASYSFDAPKTSGSIADVHEFGLFSKVGKLDDTLKACKSKEFPAAYTFHCP